MSQLKVNSIIPVAGVPTGGGGGIIQVVQAVKDDTATFTTTSFTDITGLSASITPTSSSSKILVEAFVYVSNIGNTTGMINIVRGSTNIAQPSGSVTNTASIFSYIGVAHMVQRVMTFFRLSIYNKCNNL